MKRPRAPCSATIVRKPATMPGYLAGLVCGAAAAAASAGEQS